MENTLGQNLKRIRKELGFKQEQLAEKVGVSPQAVSKWESGGYPDAALLPSIADCLGVTIDELFGREVHRLGIFDHMLMYLNEFENDEKINRLFELCRTAVSSFCGNDEYNEALFPPCKSGCNYSQATTNKGFAQCRINSDKAYFLLVPEPDNGYDSVVPYNENYVDLFKFLAMPNTLKVMYFLQTHHGTFFNVTTLVNELGISAENAGKIISGLFKLHFIWEANLDMGKNSEKIYQCKVGCDFVSLMYFAQVLLQRPYNFIYQNDSRSTPYFKSKTYKKVSEIIGADAEK